MAVLLDRGSAGTTLRNLPAGKLELHSDLVVHGTIDRPAARTLSNQ